MRRTRSVRPTVRSNRRSSKNKARAPFTKPGNIIEVTDGVRPSDNLQATKLLELRDRIYNPESAKEARATKKAMSPVNVDSYRASIKGHSLFKGLHRVTEEK